jgi:MFS family permease
VKQRSISFHQGDNKKYIQVFSLGILATSILSLITPVVTFAANIWGMVLIRILQGLAAGLAFPCALQIFSKWAPQNERSRMTSLAMSGVYFGTVVANFFSGTIAVKLGTVDHIIHIHLNKFTH